MSRPAALAVLLLVAACRERPPRTAEDAYLAVLDACERRDAARLFDALDTQTRWSIESVHHAQREMRRLIIETYPAEERDRALARIPASAEEPEEHPRRYFRRLETTPPLVEQLRKRMFVGKGQPVGSISDPTKSATVWREGGSVFNFSRDDDGRWGLSELREEWEHAKLRAVHDLETVRQNAALYGGAAPPRG